MNSNRINNIINNDTISIIISLSAEPWDFRSKVIKSIRWIKQKKKKINNLRNTAPLAQLNALIRRRQINDPVNGSRRSLAAAECPVDDGQRQIVSWTGRAKFRIVAVFLLLSAARKQLVLRRSQRPRPRPNRRRSAVLSERSHLQWYTKGAFLTLI